MVLDQLKMVYTDVSACNFNPFVTEEDGSCESTSCYGCIDQVACNYNAMTLYPVEIAFMHLKEVIVQLVQESKMGQDKY